MYKFRVFVMGPLVGRPTSQFVDEANTDTVNCNPAMPLSTNNPPRVHTKGDTFRRNKSATYPCARVLLRHPRRVRVVAFFPIFDLAVVAVCFVLLPRQLQPCDGRAYTVSCSALLLACTRLYDHVGTLGVALKRFGLQRLAGGASQAAGWQVCVGLGFQFHPAWA